MKAISATGQYLKRIARQAAIGFGLVPDSRVERELGRLRGLLQANLILPGSLMYIPAIRPGYLFDERAKPVVLVMNKSREYNHNMLSAKFGNNQAFIDAVGEVMNSRPELAGEMVAALGETLDWLQRYDHNCRQMVPFLYLLITHPKLSAAYDRAAVLRGLPKLLPQLQEAYDKYRARLDKQQWTSSPSAQTEKYYRPFSFEQWAFYDTLREIDW